MNAVVAAEAESAEAALRVEATMFAYISMPHVGSRNCVSDPRMTKPLPTRVIM